MSDIDQTQLDQKLEAVLASVQNQEFSDPELAEFIVKAAPELFGETQTQGLLDVSAVGINKLEVGLEFFGDEGNVRISSPEALQPVFNGKSEPKWEGFSVGTLVFRAKPEGEIKFFGFNAWKSILGLEGKLLLLFYGGPGFPRVACYVGPRLPGDARLCKGTGEFSPI